MMAPAHSVSRSPDHRAAPSEFRDHVAPTNPQPRPIASPPPEPAERLANLLQPVLDILRRASRPIYGPIQSRHFLQEIFLRSPLRRIHGRRVLSRDLERLRPRDLRFDS